MGQLLCRTRSSFLVCVDHSQTGQPCLAGEAHSASTGDQMVARSAAHFECVSHWGMLFLGADFTLGLLHVNDRV